MNESRPAPKEPVRPRKIIAMLTDAEWREMRVAAAEDDTTIQGMTTTLVLAAIQKRRRSS